MKFYDVIIIGGGPSGLVTGMTAKKLYPEKSILIITEEKRCLIPCGIPYIFHDLGSVEKDEMGLKPFKDAGGKVLIGSVKHVDIQRKALYVKRGQYYNYDKLVFATGSIPIVPTSIKGYDLEGVEYINKSFSHMKYLKDKADTAQNVTVVGGGFIGVEVAEQLSKDTNKTVSLIECERYCLCQAFSEELCKVAFDAIYSTGIKIYTDRRLEEIIGENGKTSAVLLSDGQLIDTDMVIMTVGYKPNTKLAFSIGLELNNFGAIKVDRYMRTNNKDIYAVGDCSETTGFVTGIDTNIMLASTATAEARVLAYNLFGINIEKHFPGTIGIFSTQINGLTLASAGVNEHIAEKSNIEYVSGEFSDCDRHPGHFSDTSSLRVKLFVSPGDGSILGGEVWGGKSVGEIINIIGLAIQKEVTVYELISYQIGTHPLLTGAPTKYSLIKAAEDVVYTLRSRNQKHKINPQQLFTLPNWAWGG